MTAADAFKAINDPIYVETKIDLRTQRLWGKVAEVKKKIWRKSTVCNGPPAKYMQLIIMICFRNMICMRAVRI